MYWRIRDRFDGVWHRRFAWFPAQVGVHRNGGHEVWVWLRAYEQMAERVSPAFYRVSRRPIGMDNVTPYCRQECGETS